MAAQTGLSVVHQYLSQLKDNKVRGWTHCCRRSERRVTRYWGSFSAYAGVT